MMEFSKKKTFLLVGTIVLLAVGIVAAALLYFTGRGLTAKHFRAFLGDVQSQAELGDYYAYEDRQPENALYWFRKAAKNASGVSPLQAGSVLDIRHFRRSLLSFTDSPPDFFLLLRRAAVFQEIIRSYAPRPLPKCRSVRPMRVKT